MDTDFSPMNLNTSCFESSNWTEAGIQSCEICCIQFNSYKEWLQHYLVQHKDDEEKNFKCDQCEEIFHRKVDLVCHKLTHSEEKSFRCDECGEKFSRVEVFIGHMNSHIHEGPASPIQSDYISQSTTAELAIKNEYGEEKMETENNGVTTENTENFAELQQEHKPIVQLQVNVSMVNDHICDVCGQCFDRHFLLIQHKEIHTKTKFSCNKCFRSFRTKEQFSQHIESDVHEKFFRCEYCECFFTRKGNLKRHIKNIHTIEKPYKCEECGEGFHLEEDLERHLKNHIHEKIFASQKVVGPSKNSLATLFTGVENKFHKCDKCGKVFNQKWNLARHMLTHTGERRFKCDLCDKAFIQRSHLDKHFRVHMNKKSNSRKIKEQVEIDDNEDVGMKMCHICGEMFDELYGHMITHDIYPCKLCCKEFSSEEELSTHRTSHSDKEKFSCNICCKDFQTEGRLLKHCQRHNALRGKKCRNPSEKKDSDGNSGEDISDDSGKIEEDARNGEESEQSDADGDLSPQVNSSFTCYPCQQCGKVLSSVWNLKRHMQTHKKEKPHLCLQCGKMFLSRSNLLRHMLIHTGEKPFKCDKCGKGFSQRPHLNKHVRKVHDEISMHEKVLSYMTT